MYCKVFFNKIFVSYFSNKYFRKNDVKVINNC